MWLQGTAGRGNVLGHRPVGLMRHYVIFILLRDNLATLVLATRTAWALTVNLQL